MRKPATATSVANVAFHFSRSLEGPVLRSPALAIVRSNRLLKVMDPCAYLPASVLLGLICVGISSPRVLATGSESEVGLIGP